MSEFNQTKSKNIPIQTDEQTNFLCLLYKISVLRCFIKWIIHLFTGTCELQRIIRSYNGAMQTLKIGNFL